MPKQLSKEFQKKLTQMNERWGDRRTSPPGAPDGEYLAELVSAELATSQKGKPQIKRTWVILEGEYKGEQERDYMHLGSEWGLYFLAQWLRQMDLEPPEDLTDLPNTLAELVDERVPVVIAKETSKEGFTNVKVVRVAGDGDEYESDEEEEEEEDDSEAFESDEDDEDETEEEEEPEEEEEEEDEAELIRWKYKGKVKEGTIVSERKDGKYLVLDHSNNRKTIVDPSDVVEDDGDDGTDDLEDLLLFCEAWGIQPTAKQKDSVEGVLKALGKYEFERSELTKEEAALLEKHCVEMIEPKPKPKTKAKAKSKSK